MSPSSAQDPRRQASSAGKWIELSLRGIAVTLEVCLHDLSTFGERYLGAQAALGLLILFVFPAFWEREDPTPVWCFGAVVLVRCLAARGAVHARIRAGAPPVHSYYSGRPSLRRLTEWMGERRVKASVEPALTTLAGFVAYSVSPPLGAYWLIASLCMLAKVQNELLAERRRLLDVRDAQLEQQRIAEDWRRTRGPY